VGISYNTSIVKSGLVLHLDAANPKSYPGSGTVWNDLSGKGNHGTLYGSPTFSGGRALFNGTNSYAEIPYDAVNFTFSYEQTIMIILSPNENDDNRRNPYNQSYAASGTWTHEPNGTINFYYGAGADTGESGTPYTNIGSATVLQNETAMMCTVRSVANNHRRWFKNDTLTSDLSGTVYNPTTNSTNIIRIGRGYAGYYSGYIDTVMLYNRALSAVEVAKNFEALRGRYGI